MNYTHLRDVMEMVIQARVRPKMQPFEWLGVLLYLEKKGWLKVFTDDGGRVIAATAAYRVKEFKQKAKDKIPEREEGNILFVPFFVSVADDRMEVPRIIKKYLSENPEIKEVVFEDKNNRVRRFRRDRHGEEQETQLAASA